MRTILGVGFGLLLACTGVVDPPKAEPPSTPTAAVPAFELKSVDALTLHVSDLVLVKGKSDAVIVQYSDWKCGHCLTALPLAMTAAIESGAELRFRNYPLASECNPAIDRPEPDRCKLALASICAHEDGSFLRFAASVKSGVETGELLGSYQSCMGATATKPRLDAQVASGGSLEIQGTPSFYLRMDGAWSELTTGAEGLSAALALNR